MQLSAKNETLLQNAATLGVGILAWEKEATRGSTESMFSVNRFGDALAGMIGNSNVKKIIPNYTGSGEFNPKPMGWINGTTAMGAMALVADWILDSNVDQYRKLPAAQSLLKGAGYGALVGGIVGGIFDPPSGGPVMRVSAPTVDSGALMAQGNTPFIRGSGAASYSSSLMS